MKKRPVALFLVLAMLCAGAFVFFDQNTSQAEYADITLNRHAEKAGMPPVVFPHWFHRIRFKCKVCHPAIFEMRAGSNDITMKKIVNKQFCGRCHNGTISWPPLYCDRCHAGKSDITIPKARGFVK